MKTAYIIKSHDHGILGVASNKKAAYNIAIKFNPPPLSHSYGQLCSEMSKNGFVFIETEDNGIVEVSPYAVNEYDPEC